MPNIFTTFWPITLSSVGSQITIVRCCGSCGKEGEAGKAEEGEGKRRASTNLCDGLSLPRNWGLALITHACRTRLVIDRANYNAAGDKTCIRWIRLAEH